MAITTYSELQTAVSNWLRRTNISDRIKEFITLAEMRIRDGSDDGNFSTEPLRSRYMVSSTTLTTVADTRTVSLPTGCIGFKGGLYIDDSIKTRLDLVSLQQLTDTYAGSETGKPKMYAIGGTNMYLGPTPDAAYNIPVLYHSFSALSDANTTNSILTNHPNIYLYGAVLEGLLYLQRDNRIETVYQAFKSAVNAANNATSMENYSGSAPQVRTDVGNP